MVANANAARRMPGNGKADLDEAREAIDDIVRDAHRASDVLGRIRARLRKGTHRTEPLAISEVNGEVVRVTRLWRSAQLARLKMLRERTLTIGLFTPRLLSCAFLKTEKLSVR